jgi:hypothetical protein
MLLGLWQSAWRMRLYIAAALSVALVLALTVSLVGYGQRQNRDDARRNVDEAALRSALVLIKESQKRITADESTIGALIRRNRQAINDNSAQTGANHLDIGDLQALVARTKADVLHEIDGVAAVGPPSSGDTVAAKLLLILSRLDALEARIAALERAVAASPSPASDRKRHYDAGGPTETAPSSPGAEPSPSERCVVPRTFECSTAAGS